MVLNNPYFVQAQGYSARLDLRQMAFLRSDLRLVPRDQLVVLMMHVPITQMSGRQEIFRLLEKRPHTLSFSAHRHVQEHRFVGKEDGWNGAQPHHHVINVTACGSWWSDWPDEVGQPHSTMSDGAPNGYSVVTFDGSSYSIRFKAARRPADYQMNIYAPDSMSSADAGATRILVNVFGGSEKSVVEMRLGDSGDWLPMEKVNANDPQYERLAQMHSNWQEVEGYGGIRAPSVCEHLWKASLPANPRPGTYMIHVRTTDMFGQTYVGRRVIYVQ